MWCWEGLVGQMWFLVGLGLRLGWFVCLGWSVGVLTGGKCMNKTPGRGSAEIVECPSKKISKHVEACVPFGTPFLIWWCGSACSANLRMKGGPFMWAEYRHWRSP